MSLKNKKQPGSPSKRILIELRRLRRIHDVTMYSYFQTREHIEEKLAKRDISGKTTLTSQIGGEETIIAQSPFELLSRLSDAYPQILRESLFVRAISQFEAFLVEIVWEIAERTIEPFKQQKNIEYPQAKLLSYRNIDDLHRDIIQQECRQLTGQGINYAEKYYQSRFDIRFKDAPIDYAGIREMHERRHLFVHRGGRIDQRYGSLYAPQHEVGARIDISAEYLRNSIATLTSLAEFILASVDLKWPPSEIVKRQISPDLTKAWSDHVSEMVSLSPDMEFGSDITFRQRSYLGYWFKVKFNDEDDAVAHISPEFPYTVEEELHYLSEILIASRQISSNEVEWLVGGPKSLVGPYIGYQKIMAERNRFIEFESQRLDL